MDPGSATVAFVGFAASIAGLAGNTVQSCQALHTFCKGLATARQNLQRLSSLIKRLEIITKQLQNLDTDRLKARLDNDTNLYWQQQANDMHTELNEFQQKVSKLENKFRSKTITPVNVTARLCFVLSSEETTRYERLFSSYIEAATLMLSLLTNSLTIDIEHTLSVQADGIDRLSKSVQSLHEQAYDDWAARRVLAVLEEDKTKVREIVSSHLNELKLNNGSKKEVQAISVLQRIPLSSASVQIQKTLTGTSCGDAVDTVPSTIDRVLDREPFNSRPSHDRKVKQPPTVAWQIAIHKFPIGILTIFTRDSSISNEQKTPNSCGQQTSWSMTFTLFPARWLARNALRLSIASVFPVFGAPSLTWSLDHATYNDDPRLLTCLKYCDVDALIELFQSGRARPTDIIAPWGNSLLHEAVFGFMSGRQRAIELYNVLLEQGADPNFRNAKGRTPLLHCCHLMKSTSEHGKHLHVVAELLIANGTDLALADEHGYSPCSLILQSVSGLQFLQSFVYRFVDLFTMQEMASSDAWILAAVARSVPEFRARLEAELRSYRTAPQLSGSWQRPQLTIPQLDAMNQVAEVRRASQLTRTTFFESLCINGTADMVQPFIDGGIDIDEAISDDTYTYARAAAKHGNLNVLSALVNGGASLDARTRPGSNTHWSALYSPVDELLERWYSLRCGRPEYRGCVDTEISILPMLLMNETFDGSDVLFRAVSTMQPENIYRYLLDAGCGRRDGLPPKTWWAKVYGSEVIEAVKCNDPNISLMLQYGLAVECEDRIGFTALLHSLDRGPGVVDFTKILIDAGANLTRRTASGLTPLELAKRNVEQAHPRRPRPSWTINKKPLALDPVSLEDDQAALELLRRAIREQKPSDNECSIRAVVSELPSLLLPRLSMSWVKDLASGIGSLCMMLLLLVLSSIGHKKWPAKPIPSWTSSNT